MIFGAHHRRKGIVFIFTGILVLNKIFRTNHFPQIMIVSPHTAKEGIGADGIGAGFSQIPHNNAVVKCTVGFMLEAL